jgi:hypothetical protein
MRCHSPPAEQALTLRKLAVVPLLTFSPAGACLDNCRDSCSVIPYGATYCFDCEQHLGGVCPHDLGEVSRVCILESCLVHSCSHHMFHMLGRGTRSSVTKNTKPVLKTGVGAALHGITLKARPAPPHLR